MLTSSIAIAQEKISPIDNPLFNRFNQPIDFKKIKPVHFTEAVDHIMAVSNSRINKITSAGELNFNSTLLILDNLYCDLNTINSILDLLSNVLSVESEREAALENLSRLSKYYVELQLNEDLYKTIKRYSQTEEAKTLSGPKKKMLTEVVRNFERNGLALPKEKRDELKAIQNRLSDEGIKFNAAIESSYDSLVINSKQSEGLPPDFLESRKQKDGTYKIDLSYPSYYPFMKYCKNDAVRKQLYIKFNSRAKENIETLKIILSERKKMAHLLGFSSYAEYALDDKMAKTPAAVWKFEDDLISKIRPKAEKDYDELLKLKKETDKDAVVIFPWEAGFYSNKLLETKYDLDGEKVKQYFELNNVLSGLFMLTQKLFNLEFSEVKDPSVWHEDVRMFEVKQDGKMISRFYLDLFPRKNKYSHAACFGIIGGEITGNGYQYPAAALVCNFPKPENGKPSLLPHGDVETFFHEFGHVLHNMLTTSELFFFSGTNVALDYVEAPSQIFENWAWEYDALKLFAKHSGTGEVLPAELHKKMLASKNAGSGLNILQQIFYGELDMTLEDKFDADGNVSTTDVVKELQNKITLYPYLEGTHMQSSFGHLKGYGAGYYGYLWSKVYAQDMFSVFKKNGIMDQKTGLRYRDIILAKGSSEPEIDLVKDFLGREPDPDAFIKDLGVIVQ